MIVVMVIVVVIPVVAIAVVVIVAAAAVAVTVAVAVADMQAQQASRQVRGKLGAPVGESLDEDFAVLAGICRVAQCHKVQLA